MLHEIKVISCNQTRYKPSLETRAVAKRADQLHQEYVEKQKLLIRNLEGLSLVRLVVLKLNYQLFQKWKGWFLETGVKVVKLCMH